MCKWKIHDIHCVAFCVWCFHSVWWIPGSSVLCSVYQYFGPFYGWIIPPGMDMQHMAYPFTNWWVFQWFPLCGCCEHLCPNFCVKVWLTFSQVYTQVWDWEVIYRNSLASFLIMWCFDACLLSRPGSWLFILFCSALPPDSSWGACVVGLPPSGSLSYTGGLVERLWSSLIESRPWGFPLRISPLCLPSLLARGHFPAQVWNLKLIWTNPDILVVPSPGQACWAFHLVQLERQGTPGRIAYEIVLFFGQSVEPGQTASEDLWEEAAGPGATILAL